MVGSTRRQGSLFYAAFGRQASLIKDDLLEQLDALLEDEVLLAVVSVALARRRPRSAATGRIGIAPDRLLRCCVLKQLRGWSFRELERELRGSLVYRRFTRFDEDPIPSFSTFSRTFALLGDEGTRQIHEQVVRLAQREEVAKGARMRSDTTVAETNVHHPTDSTLLADGIRVLTRGLRRIARECKGVGRVRDYGRSVKRRLLEIHRAAKALTEANRVRLRSSYQDLVRTTRQVVKQAKRVLDDFEKRRLQVIGDVRRVVVGESELRHFVPLVEQVFAQTVARVFEGNRHAPGKLTSLFETHTEIICKGKAHKPTEFGRLVRIDEVENGIVSNYDVKEGNPPDQHEFLPAVEEHLRLFGRAPRMATADRGYFSARNERLARQLGVERVALPARGRLSRSRAQLQKERWFRRALRWRAGIEARIATLKHRFGMARVTYKGDAGFKRYIGWSVICQNLVAIARVQSRREVQRRARAAQKAA